MQSSCAKMNVNIHKNNIVVMIKLARSGVSRAAAAVISRGGTASGNGRVESRSDELARSESATPFPYRIYDGRKLLKKDYVPREIS